MKAGFALILRSTSKRESKNYSETCNLCCQHGAVFRHRTAKNVQVSKSKWRVGENDQCKYRIIISLNKDCDRWVLKNTRMNYKNVSDIHTCHFNLGIQYINTGIALLSPSGILL